MTEEAAEEARAVFTVPEEAHAVDVVRDLLLGRAGDGPEHAEFRARFAQTSSALRAKSVEDTAFYRYVPLLSANEVGGNPGAPAVSPEDFHAYCARVQRDWPATGTALSTHDTKRSADVRAALSVLTQCPERWADVLAEVTREGTTGVPDPQTAWAAWQTVFGLGPADAQRVQGHCSSTSGKQGCTPPGPSRTPRTRSRWRPSSRRALRAARTARGRLPGLARPARPGERPGGRSGPADDARGARRLPGHRGRVPGAGGPGQPGAVRAPEQASAKAALTTAALRLRGRRPEVFGDAATYVPLAAEGRAPRTARRSSAPGR